MAEPSDAEPMQAHTRIDQTTSEAVAAGRVLVMTLCVEMAASDDPRLLAQLVAISAEECLDGRVQWTTQAC